MVNMTYDHMICIHFANHVNQSIFAVAMIAETRAEWLITAYACFKNNLSVVTIYTNLGNDGIIHALNETKVTVAFCSHDTLKKLAQVSQDVSDINFNQKELN